MHRWPWDPSLDRAWKGSRKAVLGKGRPLESGGLGMSSGSCTASPLTCSLFCEVGPAGPAGVCEYVAHDGAVGSVGTLPPSIFPFLPLPFSRPPNRGFFRVLDFLHQSPNPWAPFLEAESLSIPPTSAIGPLPGRAMMGNGRRANTLLLSVCRWTRLQISIP